MGRLSCDAPLESALAALDEVAAAQGAAVRAEQRLREEEHELRKRLQENRQRCLAWQEPRARSERAVEGVRFGAEGRNDLEWHVLHLCAAVVDG